MDVSILIVNWNTCSYLRQCLQSIREKAGEISYEVIVVDNASHDGSAAMVEQEFPEVTLCVSNENLGFARGNNLAYSKSSGSYVLIMNPDIILLEDALKGLVAFSQSHPDAGLTSPKLLNPDHTPQKKYYGRIHTLSAVFFIYTHLGSLIDSRLLGNRIRKRERYEKYGDFKEALSFTDGGAGFCCTLVPRRLIEDLGFFDERFPVFFNDGDLAFRFFQAGYKAYITPDVQVCHYGGSSVEQLPALTFNSEYVYGLRAYCLKHRGRLYTLAIDAVLSLNVLYDLVRTARDIVRRKKRFQDMRIPVSDFRKALAYRPPNAISNR